MDPMPLANLGQRREATTRRSSNFTAGDWWILGSTNYAIVGKRLFLTKQTLIFVLLAPGYRAADCTSASEHRKQFFYSFLYFNRWLI